jgi:hypothetical protein
MAHIELMRHRILPFRGACRRMRHRTSMGFTRDPVLHMCEKNSVAHLPTCATKNQQHAPQNSLWGPSLTSRGHNSMAHTAICATEVQIYVAYANVKCTIFFAPHATPPPPAPGSPYLCKIEKK